MTKVLVENEKVRVTETTYPPGISSGMSERGPRVVNVGKTTVTLYVVNLK